VSLQAAHSQARDAVIGNTARHDPYADYFREAVLRQEVERLVNQTLPVSNDADQNSAVRRVLASTDIGVLLRQHHGDVNSVVADIVQRCQKAADHANAINSIMHQWMRSPRDGTGGPIRYKIIRRQNGLSMDDLAQSDHEQIQGAIEEVFESRSETERAQYMDDIGMWRIGLSGARFVYLSVDSIKMLHGQSLMPSLGGVIYAAPRMVGGALQFAKESIAPDIASMAQSALVASVLALLAAQMLADQQKREEAAKSERLKWADVDDPATFKPVPDVPHPAILHSRQPAHRPM